MLKLKSVPTWLVAWVVMAGVVLAGALLIEMWAILTLD
jgi:hypothetical protein